MPVDLTEVRELFFEESFENLDVMESNLLDLEIGSLDKELINSIFRAAHSIKGGAGIFKFENIITFSHVTETLLDEMRNGEHVITQSLIDLLLRSVDVMRMLLSSLQEETEPNIQEMQACQDQLQSWIKGNGNGNSSENHAQTASDGPASSSETTEITEFSAEEAVTDSSHTSLAATDSENGWQISFKPYPSMLKTGNDPINLFRELSHLGDLKVKADMSQLPNFTDLDPESCYLSWELILQGDIERSTIEEIFEWVEEDCDLQIIPLGESLSVSQEEMLSPSSEEKASLEKNQEKSEDISSPSEKSLKESAEEKLEEISKESLKETSAEQPEEQSIVSSTEDPQIETKDSTESITTSSSTDSQKEALVSTTPSETSSKESESETSIKDADEKQPMALNSAINQGEEQTAHVSKPLKKQYNKEPAEPPNSNESSGLSHQAGHHASESNSIRVGIDKIDHLINIVGELVITQSMLDQVGENFDDTKVTQLHDGLSQLERNTRELQESVMRIRMLPISFSFNRFPRLVHDLSVHLGKKVELKLSGEHTELDKTVLEKMSDPLVHLVRNALDHGIEIPEERLAAGKPEVGRLHLHAFHQGGNIIIQISDDGAGFDLDKIYQKAIEKELISPDDHISEEQLYEFIFHPGFSTAIQVSDLSGRGVGMDVVRRNIRTLGGSIDVQSKRGQGSIFNIRLPLTLAILDGQLVRVGRQIYILSLLSIVESLRVKPKSVNSLAGRAEVYKLRDEYIPILRLYALFDVSPGTTQLEEGLLVIVEGDGQKIGLFVDELLSQQQIVIKSLETNFKQIQGVSGATILGDGSVALILDIGGLIQLFHHQAKLPISRLQKVSISS